MTRSLLPREILWCHISKTRRAISLKFCIRDAFMDIMTHQSFISIGWCLPWFLASGPLTYPRAWRTTEKAGPDTVKGDSSSSTGHAVCVSSEMQTNRDDRLFIAYLCFSHWRQKINVLNRFPKLFYCPGSWFREFKSEKYLFMTGASNKYIKFSNLQVKIVKWSSWLQTYFQNVNLCRYFQKPSTCRPYNHSTNVFIIFIIKHFISVMKHQIESGKWPGKMRRHNLFS